MKKTKHLIILSTLGLLCSAINSQDVFLLPLEGPQGGETHSIAINSDDHIYISTGWKGANGMRTGRNGIFKSTDYGNTWDHIMDPLTKGRFSNCIEITNDDDIFVGTYGGGIHHSANDGNSWKYANDTLLNRMKINNIISIDDTILFANSDKAAFRSWNKGKTWQELENPLGVKWGYIYKSSGNILFSYSYTGKFFWSADLGDTWTVKDAPSYLNIRGMALMGDDTIFIADFTSGVLRSTNRGNNWTTMNNGLPYPFRPLLLDITIHKESLFLSSRDYGIYKSDDYGASWYTINIGLSRTHINSIKSLNDSLLIACSDGGAYISDDDGASWRESKKGLNNAMIFALVWSKSDNSLYAGSSGGVLKSSNKGKDWITINDGLIKDRDVLDLGVNNNGVLFVSLDEKGIFRSTDGKSWVEVSNSLIAKGDINQILCTDSEDIYLKVNKSSNSNYEGVVKSNNLGDTWVDIASGLGGHKVWSLAANSAGTLFAATSGGAYSTSNKGSTWTKLSIDTITNFEMQNVYIDENDIIYIKAKIPPYSYITYNSSDNGISWDHMENVYLSDEMLSVGDQYVFGSSTSGNSSSYGVRCYSIHEGVWERGSVIYPFLEYPQPTFSLTKDNEGTVYAGTGTGIYITNPYRFTGEEEEICEGEDYSWNGTFLTETGIYYDSLQTIHGEDSIVGLALTVNKLPESVNIIGPVKVQPGDTAYYYMENVSENSYYWYITGGTKISFRSDTDVGIKWGGTGMGEVRVKVGDGECIRDTTIQVAIGNVSTEIENSSEKVRILYDRISKQIWLESSQSNDLTIRIISIDGKIVYFNENAQVEEHISVGNLTEGIYIVNIKTDNEIFSRKILFY